MKKTIVMGLFVLSLSLTGCFNKDQAAAPEQEPAADTNSVPDLVVDEVPNLSLSEWLERGEAAKCTVASPTGSVEAFVLGNKVKIAGIGFDPSQPTEMGYLMSDGEWVHTWTGSTGVKFNAIEMANQAQGGANGQQQKNWKETVAAWENSGVEYSCEQTAVTDDMFVVPAEVVFSDLGALLDVASSTPSGLMNRIPGNTEDVEAALEAAGITPLPESPVKDATEPEANDRIIE